MTQNKERPMPIRQRLGGAVMNDFINALLLTGLWDDDKPDRYAERLLEAIEAAMWASLENPPEGRGS